MAEAVAAAPAWRIRFQTQERIKALALAVAFFAVFWKLLDFLPWGGLGELVYRWTHELDWSHGPLIPLFSAYLVYAKWDEIRRCPIRFAWLGLPVLLAGLLGYVWALFLLPFGYAKPFFMMVTLLGLIVLMVGLPAMKYLWLPWMYLFFAIPLPKSIYFELTTPLRMWAASLATTIMGLVPGLDIRRNGSVIEALYSGEFFQVGVADACAGMRSTITLCALGVAIAFLSQRPWWQRLILVASCLPIALFCNFIRVLTTTWLYIFVDEKYAEGTYHTALGLVTLGLAFAMFSGLGWLMSHLVVEEEVDEDDDDGAADAPRPQGAMPG